MFQIKQIPEDFVVDEKADIKASKHIDLNKEDYYSYFTMEKKNWNTRDAVNELAKRLRIKSNRINIAGIKDKNAITRQAISIYKVSRRRVGEIKIKDIRLRFIGYGKDRIKLGQIIKNRFSIVVRNLDSKKFRKTGFIENYYDDQRFGGSNHMIGQKILARDFIGVCEMLNLKVVKNDYIGAIRHNVDRKMLVFYLNAYQSYLFNLFLSEYVKKNSKKTFSVKSGSWEYVFSEERLPNKKAPIIGFLSVIRDKEIKGIYDRLLMKEGVKKEDFLLPMMPELSSEGNERDIIVDLNAHVSYHNDELNKGKLKAIVEFELDKGAYATLAIKKMFA